MNNQGATGIATAIILISFILIGATAASVIMGDSGNNPEENYEEILEEALDEVSTYIQIKDVLGKYNSATEEQHIQKIAILIKPLFSIDIDASELMIKLNNGKQIKMLYYNRQAKFISSNSLFEHPMWTTMRDTDFGFIVILDKDQSIIDYGTINDNTDMIKRFYNEERRHPGTNTFPINRNNKNNKSKSTTTNKTNSLSQLTISYSKSSSNFFVFRGTSS